MASTNWSKKPNGKSGSGSSLKNIFSAPVTTWMSSHWLSSKFSFSSGKTWREMEQLVLMKQLQDTNYYVNVCLLSSATVNSLLHLEVSSCAIFHRRTYSVQYHLQEYGVHSLSLSHAHTCTQTKGHKGSCSWLKMSGTLIPIMLLLKKLTALLNMIQCY